MKKIANIFLLAAAIGAISSPIVKNTARVQYAAEVASEIEDAFSLIDEAINMDRTKIVSDFRLPFESIHGVEFTWTSPDESVIKITETKDDQNRVTDVIAHVTRGTEDKTITLTCEAKYVTTTETFTGTKTYDFVVLKDTEAQTIVKPLVWQDDFTNYKEGIDISNYYRWSISGDPGKTRVINGEDFPNINNLVSSKALEITSERQTSKVSYTNTEINVNSTNIKQTSSTNSRAVL